jgi:cystinyl aminopeptidase
MLVLVVLMLHYLSYSLPTDVMVTVFKVGARTEKGWLFLFSMYSSMGSEAEKNKILEALASSEDVHKLYWYGTTQRT